MVEDKFAITECMDGCDGDGSMLELLTSSIGVLRGSSNTDMFDRFRSSTRSQSPALVELKSKRDAFLLRPRTDAAAAADDGSDDDDDDDDDDNDVDDDDEKVVVENGNISPTVLNRSVAPRPSLPTLACMFDELLDLLGTGRKRGSGCAASAIMRATFCAFISVCSCLLLSSIDGTFCIIIVCRLISISRSSSCSFLIVCTFLPNLPLCTTRI